MVKNDRSHGNDGDDNVLDTYGDNDEDHACDGKGADFINLEDTDGRDTWYQYPEGEAEVQVSMDDTAGDNTVTGQTSCPVPTAW